MSFDTRDIAALSRGRQSGPGRAARLFGATLLSATLCVAWAQLAPAATTITTIDSVGDVGRSPSIAIDSSGKARIAYGTNQDLKLASWNGTSWDLEVVDSSVGWAPSLTIDSAGRPHVVYVVSGDLRYARWTGTSWVIQTLSTGVISGGGQGGRIALDATGNAHIAYSVSDGGQGGLLKYARWTGGAWEYQVVDSTGFRGMWYPAIAVDSRGRPHIAYEDYGAFDLKYAYWNGASWTIRQFGMQEVEGPISMVLDGADRPHITFEKGAPESHPDYVRWTGTGWEYGALPNPDVLNTGWTMSLAISSNGVAHVAYSDKGDAWNLYHAWRQGGVWSRALVDGSTTTIYKSVAIDESGQLHIAYCADGGKDLKYALVSGGDGLAPAVAGGNGRGRTQAPTGFMATSGGPSSLIWRWTDNASSEQGYALYGSLSSTGPFSLIADVSTLTANTTFYKETGLSPRTTYYRYVAAIDGGGFVTSDLASAVTPAAFFSTATVTNGAYAWLDSAIDDAGDLHVVYRGLYPEELRYVKRTGGVWGSLVVVEDAQANFDVSLAVDKNRNPHISYYKPESPTALKYAHYNGSSWSKEEVDNSCGESCGGNTSIAVDANNKPHIIYTQSSAGQEMLFRYARYDGSSWTKALVPGATGYQPALALDVLGRPRFVYGFQVNGLQRVGLASFDGTSWSVSTIDSADRVGFSPSIAIDGEGNSHISYLDSNVVGGQGLTYLTLPAGVKTLIDQESGAGGYSSITLDGDGHPHISYHNTTTGVLKYARFDGISWSTVTVDDVEPGDTSISLDPSGRPNIMYMAPPPSYGLKAAVWGGSGFWPPMGSNGQGRVQMPTSFSAGAVHGTSVTWTWTDNSSNELGFRLYGASSSTGPYTLIAGTSTLPANTTSFTETGLSWGTTYYRYLAAGNAGGWVTSGSTGVTTSASAFPTDVIQANGEFSSLALDAQGRPHIGYFDRVSLQLKYTRWNGASWVAEVVKSLPSISGQTRLALDASGNAHLSYYNPSGNDLEYVRWTGTSWSTQAVDAGGDVGLNNSIAIDGAGNVHIAYYDSTNKDLKYAFSNGGNWVAQTLDSGGDVGLFPRIIVDGQGDPRIAYVDSTNGNIKLARRTGGVWGIQTVDGSGNGLDMPSLAMDGQESPVIAYYEGVGGNLKLARWNGTSWQIQTVAIAGDVGRHSAVALDGAGNPHVLHRDQTNNLLLYSFWTGTAWQTVPVDAADAGWTSLSLDGSGKAHASYFDNGGSGLKYGKWSGASFSAPIGGGVGNGRPLAPSGLIPAVVHQTSVTWTWTDNSANELGFRLFGASSSTGPFTLIAGTSTLTANTLSFTETGLNWDASYYRYVSAGNAGGWATSNSTVAMTPAAAFQTQVIQANGEFSSLALDAQGRPHIGYFDRASLQLKYTRWDGASWVTQVVKSLPSISGQTRLALDALGNAHLSYYNPSANDLEYARWTGTSWGIEAVDTGGDVGLNNSIAIDGAGNVHIAYLDSTNGDLKYAFSNGGSWAAQTVDSGGSVGQFPRIVVNGQCDPAISYVDSTNGNIKLARRTGGVWSIQTVDNSGNGLDMPSLAMDGQESPVIAYYEGVGGNLKLARWNGTSWQIQTVASAGDVGSQSALALDGAGNPQILHRDQTHNILLYSYWTGSAWESVPVDNVDARGASLSFDGSGTLHVSYFDYGGSGLKYGAWGGRGLSAPMGGGTGNGRSLAPSGLTPAGVNQTSVTWNWADNSSNELGFRLYGSASSTGPYVLIVGTATLAANTVTFTETGLTSDTTMYRYVVALNAGGLAGTGQVQVQARFDTTPPVGSPSTPTDSGVFTSLSSPTFSWTPGTLSDPQSGISDYHLQAGTSPATNSAGLFDGTVGAVLSKAISGAQDGQTCYARVRAINGSGVGGTFSAWSDGITIDLSTPAAPSVTSNSHPLSTATYASQQPDFAITGPVDSSGITGYFWKLDALPGSIPTAADTLAQSSVSIQTLLADGTWYFHVAAKDGAGNVGLSASHFKLMIRTSVDPASGGTITGPNGNTVTIPIGAIPTATQITIQPPVSPPVAITDPALKATPVVQEIKLADGTHQLNAPITISLTYAASDVAGLNEDSLRLFFFDDASRTWVLVHNSSVDRTTRRVTGSVTHLTIFGILSFSASGAALGSVSNYPNPFSPLRGQTTKIHYSLNQSRDVRIRIYDAFGQLVWDRSLGSGQAGGVLGSNDVAWDGRSGNGSYVAKGGYLAVIESGGDKTILKIGVK